jgi:hypothetical protein
MSTNWIKVCGALACVPFIVGFANAEPGPRYGAERVNIWDIDHDGYPEVLASDPDAHEGKGAIYLFRGPVGQTLPDPSVAQCEITWDRQWASGFGERMKLGCDYSGDGVPEIIVSAQVGTGADAVMVTTDLDLIGL